jgi:hypothetical protein
MDEFDAVDIVYNAVAAAGTDVMIYKDKSEAGLTNEHIVINHLQLNELSNAKTYYLPAVAFWSRNSHVPVFHHQPNCVLKQFFHRLPGRSVRGQIFQPVSQEPIHH